MYQKSNRPLLLSLLALIAGMTMLTYAAVPLYRLFCQVTGFGGTTQSALHAPAETYDRELEIRFNADIDPNLDWDFKPSQISVKVKVGEEKIIYYDVHNRSSTALTGTAIFNVTPHIAGQHFMKVHCFCFENQTLKPGESVKMPVTFFVDPGILKDEKMNNVQTITLSYTFFPVDKNQ